MFGAVACRDEQTEPTATPASSQTAIASPTALEPTPLPSAYRPFEERFHHEPHETYGVVVTDSLQLLAQPGLDDPYAAVLTFGEGVQVLGRTPDATWLYVVSAESGHGWASSAGMRPSIVAGDLSGLPVVAVPGLWVIDMPGRGPPRPTGLEAPGSALETPQWLPADPVIA